MGARQPLRVPRRRTPRVRVRVRVTLRIVFLLGMKMAVEEHNTAVANNTIGFVSCAERGMHDPSCIPRWLDNIQDGDYDRAR